MIFVVAEIGVNWDGDFNLLKEMISKAKESGCNAVKLQAFQEIMVENHPEKQRLMNSSVNEKNVNRIDKIAKSFKMEWFCTPMYPEAVDFLNPYVKRFKIRVADGKPLLKNKISPLIKRVLETKKEVIISSETNPKNSKYYNHSKISWLYCVPKYPCSLTDLNFVKIKDFNGYSNHCVDFLAPLTAAMLGSKIIEIHITSDKSKNFIDNNVSFDYDDLKELVKLIRKSEKIRK